MTTSEYSGPIHFPKPRRSFFVKTLLRVGQFTLGSTVVILTEWLLVTRMHRSDIGLFLLLFGCGYLLGQKLLPASR